jgi:hypothetical protein
MSHTASDWLQPAIALAGWFHRHVIVRFGSPRDGRKFGKIAWEVAEGLAVAGRSLEKSVQGVCATLQTIGPPWQIF